MRLSIQSVLITPVCLGLMLLMACGSSTQTSNFSTDGHGHNHAVGEAHSHADGEEHAQAAGDGFSQGGQVIETGPYHLELLPVVENDGIHLDFFLQQGDAHEPIPDAEVIAQIQLPNGEQKSAEFTYDQAGEHYAVYLPATAAGEYKVVVQTDINGEKVNGRFSFNQ
ncbi:MAG: hypothetical protein F6K19_34130 [Cyanothece sp. SIO1E1]|nr:hypothetical protein [Cyanothece sp. SIO1E1]